MSDPENDIERLLEESRSVHFAPGPNYKQFQRYEALKEIQRDEVKSIYHLVESHVPGLRFKTVFAFGKMKSEDNEQVTFCKDRLNPKCGHSDSKQALLSMLGKLKEMPSEWTLVQLTPSFNVQENLEISKHKCHTSSLYVSVFTCGSAYRTPFCVHVDAPRDKVNNSIVELSQEIYNIVAENKQQLKAPQFKKGVGFKNKSTKMAYIAQRVQRDDNLKKLVKDLQSLWLAEWRCLFVGRYCDTNLEHTIRTKIINFLEKMSLKTDEKVVNVVQCLIKGSCYLNLGEIRRTVQYCFPKVEERSVHTIVIQFVKNLHEELSLTDKKKHPVILVVDDNLDLFPWEMIDVLIDEPVSRVPSLYLAYALYKQHKNTIKDGYKILEKYDNGKFIVNPGLDLAVMEDRMKSFFKYWMPDWTGISGCTPTEEQFKDSLLSADIFTYHGHGNGAQYFPLNKVHKLRLNTVVLLFGCSSTKLTNVGPQVEMFGTHQMYLISWSPCVVGMLWDVTDTETDVLTTEFLSLWVPSKTEVHWKDLDIKEWKNGQQSEIPGCVRTAKINKQNEPDILRAVSLAKKANGLFYYLTRAAFIARGIPVKIQC